MSTISKRAMVVLAIVAVMAGTAAMAFGPGGKGSNQAVAAARTHGQIDLDFGVRGSHALELGQAGQGCCVEAR